MTTGNRATKYENLYKSLKKHFKPTPEVGERSVLEHLLYACCLEDARYEQADEAFAKLQQAYFDWNEVRVTTVIELSEALGSLPNSSQAGTRIKQCLQSMFESRYQYDIDDMKKANLGKCIEDLQAWKGVSPFVVSYVSQHALGGHAIPIGAATLEALTQCDIITPVEAEKRSVPGLERAIPKNKGSEFGSLLHQFSVEMMINPKNALVAAVLKDMGAAYKAKPKPVPPAKPVAKKETPVVEETPKATAKPIKADGKESKVDTKADVAKAAPKKSELVKSVPAKDDKKTPAPKPAIKAPEKVPEKVVPAKTTPAAVKKVEPPAKPVKNSTEKAPDKAKPDSKAAAKQAETAKSAVKASKPKAPPAKDHKSVDKSKEKAGDKSKEKPKAAAKPAPKKVAPPPKTNSKSSVASSITKKKPK